MSSEVLVKPEDAQPQRGGMPGAPLPPSAIPALARLERSVKLLWLAGLALAIGALLGFWAVPQEGRWAWGAPVLFSRVLGNAVVAPWLALIALIFAVGAGTLAHLLHHRVISRALGLVGGAIMALSFVLTLLLARGTGLEGPGPTLLLVAQVMLATGLIAQAWRAA